MRGDRQDQHRRARFAALEQLEREHTLQSLVIAMVRRDAHEMRLGRAVDAVAFRRAIEFTRVFIEGYHYPKEELFLFVRLLERTERAVVPVAAMVRQHRESRHYIDTIERSLPLVMAGDHPARLTLVQNAAAYATLTETHQRSEQKIIFPLAREALLRDDHAWLMERFSELTDRSRKSLFDRCEELRSRAAA